MTHRQRTTIQNWLPLIIAILTMVATAGVTWGASQSANAETSARVQINTARIEKLRDDYANLHSTIEVIKSDVGWMRKQMEKK